MSASTIPMKEPGSSVVTKRNIP